MSPSRMCQYGEGCRRVAAARTYAGPGRSGGFYVLCAKHADEAEKTRGEDVEWDKAARRDTWRPWKPNPLTSRERDSIIVRATLDARRADMERDPYTKGARAGSAIRGRQIAKEFSEGRFVVANPKVGCVTCGARRATKRSLYCRACKAMMAGLLRARRRMQKPKRRRNSAANITRAAVMPNPREPAPYCRACLDGGAQVKMSFAPKHLYGGQRDFWICPRCGHNESIRKSRGYRRTGNPAYKDYRAALAAAKKLSKKLGCPVEVREV